MIDDPVRRTVASMGTLVTIHVVGSDGPARGVDEAVERAFDWFRRIEEACTRFDPSSEVMQLATRPGVAVPVSPIVYAAVELALAVAEESGGAFDPTIGLQMEARGFNREYRSGRTVRTDVDPGRGVSFQDVHLDPERHAITLGRPLVLDLGAVAKGLAVDMAARELQPFKDFAIDAGGDLYLAGHNAERKPWTVGIRHPRRDHELIDGVRVSDRAVCTSGDYERRDPADAARHHIIDPRTGMSAGAAVSATVVAPTAMAADALATAAFVLGPVDGIRLLDRQGVDGVIFTPALERHATRGMVDEYSLGRAADAAVRGDSAILPNA